MIRGGITMKNSAWRLGAAEFTGDIVWLTDSSGHPTQEIMRNGWMRDAFHCQACEATLVFDGRKAAAHEGS